jgi:hypothetical protein
MNKPLILCALAALAAFGQSQTPLTITQSAGSATGELRMQERRTNGTNYVGIKAPQSVAANTVWALPAADGTSNQCLSTDGAGQWGWRDCSGASTRYRISDYFWIQTPGGSISPGLTTVTLTPCPSGLDATDTKLYVYISGGTGTAEAAPLSVSGGAGTCSSGAASGTIKFTAANSHTGAWTIQNAGFRETERIADHGDILLISNVDVYERTVIEKGLTLEGGGGGGVRSVITAHGDIVAIDVDLAAPVTMSNFSIMAASPQVSAGAAVRLGVDGSTNHNCGSKIDNLFIYQFYYGIHLKDGCKPVITRNEIADSTKYGIYAQNIFNPDGGDGFIAHNTIGNTPAADAAIRYESGGGLKIIDNKILNNFQWGVDLYPNSGASTGQLYITSNSFDRMKAGGIRASGTDAWYGVNVIGNIIIDAGEDGTFTCVEFANPGMVGGSFVGNMCQSGQYAITASQGTQIRIGRNNFTGSEVINSSVDIDLDSPLETTHANIPTDALDGSVMYCTDCTSTGAASGTGAAIYRVNGAWSTSSTGLMNISQGGDTFGVDMHIGTDDSHDVLIYRNNVLTGQYAAGQVVTYGYHTFADNGTTMRMQPGTGVGNFGNFSNHPIDFYTDSAARWRLSATGMLHPSVHDAVDAGLTGTRIRGVYAKFGEFYKSGSTASADYLTTRKYNILDQSGGTGVWDIQASGSMAATSSIKIRDNAGSRWLEAYRALGGTPLKYTSLFGHLYPAKRLIADGDAVDDSVFGDLGATSARWANIYGAAADLSGALTASGNITGAIINATGSPAYRVGGTTVIDSARAASLTSATVTAGSAGYINLTNVVNSTQGVYGSCMALSATDAATTNTYVAGRICGRYDTASFTDELITIQTATGVGAYDTAISIKNQAVTVTGVLDAATFNATGSPAYRVSGTTVINASREATFAGLTIATGAASGYVWTSDGSGVGSWQAAAGGLPVVDTTGIAKGSSDATKIARLEVDGLTTGTTRVLTVQDGDHTLAGLNINQTFVNPQTVAIASVQNQLTLSQTNNSGFYDPACLVLASTDTVTSTIYGAARVCAGYESAVFTDEKFAIQTATGSGTYQDAITIKNQAVTILGSIAATGSATFSFVNGVVDGTMVPLFSGNGSIGSATYKYGDFFGVRGNFNAATITNNGPALGAGQNIAPLWVTGTSGFVSFGLYRTDDTNGGWLFGTSGLAVGDFAIYQNQGAGSPARRLSIGTSGAVDVPGALTTTGLTIDTGAATVGYVWTATSTGGAGSWQAASGGSSLPVVDTTGIAKGSSDATKIARLEVDGLTTGTTRVLTVQDGDYTLAGLNINQTFVNPQTIAIASVQNQLTLSQTNNSGFYDPACLVLASTDTVTSTIYGAARVCAGYESAVFTDEKFAIQTATGSGTYQDAITIKNQAVTILGSIAATGSATFSFVNGVVDGTMVPLFSGNGSIGSATYKYGDFFGVRGNFNAVTIGAASATVRLGQTLDVNYSGDFAGMAINTWSATDGHGGIIDLNKSGSGTIGTQAAVVSGETLGFLIFRGSDGTAFQRAAQVMGEVDGTVSSGVVPGRIVLRTASTSGVMTERLRIDSAGLASFYAGVDITGNLSAAVINATGSPAYRVAGTTVIDASRNASFVGLTLAGTITGDLIPATNNVYVNGSSTAYWNQTASETFYVENSGRIRPRTANTGSVGISSARFNKGWFTDLDITGTITPPSGTAFSGTKTVRDAAGTGTCTLTFSSGIMTGGTC